MANLLSPIYSAIMTHYGNLDDDNQFDDGLYFVQAPQGQTGNWATFNYDGGDGDEIMGDADDVIENAEIRFNLFTDADDNGATIAEMLEKLTNAFDWANLSEDGFTVTSHDCIKVQRISTAPVLYIDNIWQVAVIYEISLMAD